MNEKERLIKVLNGDKVNRPPVICPGGMMNAAVTEVVSKIDKNHNESLDAMVEASIKVKELTGFENYGVPFCMTCEAEPLGAKVDLGSKQCEPRVIEYNKNDIESIMKNYNVNPLTAGRMSVVLNAIKELKNDTIPVIGNITGPLSTATSIVDALLLIKMLRKNPESAYKFIDFVNSYLIEYAKLMVKSGADVIAISDPTAAGEILGRKNFEFFALPMYKKLTDAVHILGKPIIIHICGNSNNILESLNTLKADALSFDSIVNMKAARSKISTRLMGNVNTQLLQDGPVERIISITQNCIDSGVDILSPACGLSMTTPVVNLKSMTDYVKGRI